MKKANTRNAPKKKNTGHPQPFIPRFTQPVPFFTNLTSTLSPLKARSMISKGINVMASSANHDFTSVTCANSRSRCRHVEKILQQISGIYSNSVMIQ